MDGTVYDVCIVGAGMIGSAAARHASLIPGTKVCLIGPEEPKTRSKARVWGAYYDEGRIYHSGGSTHTFWNEAAKRSIARYRHLEDATGIKFHTEAGSLCVGRTNSDFMKTRNNSCENYSPDWKEKFSQQINDEFPYLSLSEQESGVHQVKEAGYVNPRAYVKAAQKFAVQKGCDIMNDVVTHVMPNTQSDGSVMYLVKCGRGLVRTSKVLIATGAFTDFFRLLPAGYSPDTKLLSQYVILAEIGPADLQRLRSMPVMLYRHGDQQLQSGIFNPSSFSNYILPPIRYPDGKYYLKLGHGPEFEYERRTEAEVRDQFCQPVPDHVRQGLTDMFYTVFKGIRPVSLQFDSCVTVNTVNRLPYISMATRGIGVALGGNGHAAKCCDELGRAAAELVVRGQWVGPGEATECQLQTKAKSKV